MNGQWGLVIFLWGGIFSTLIAIFLNEKRKTPEQKQQDREKAQERWIACRQAEQKRREQRSAPSYGCLFNVTQSILLIVLIFVLLLAALFLFTLSN